jgi:hypothetical protein
MKTALRIAFAVALFILVVIFTYYLTTLAGK